MDPEQPEKNPMSSKKWNGAIRIAGIVGVVALLTITSAVGFGPLFHAGPSGSNVNSAASTTQLSGDRELALAAASLDIGGGPALGIPQICSSTGSGSERCASHTSASLTSSTGGYVWENLTKLANAGPSGRLGAAMAWDASDGYVLLFGGESVTEVAVGDTWTYLNGVWTNETANVTGAPPAIVGGAMAFDPSSGKIVLFGGWNRTEVSQNYTYTYHAGAWTNITTIAGTPPSGRIFPTLMTDSTDGQLILFGGRGPSGNWLRDTWTFKNGLWTNVTSLQPFAMPVIYSPILTDDPGEGALLFGPAFWGSNSVHASTFVFHAGAWQNLTSTLLAEPPAFLYGAGVYVPSISGVFAFGAAYFNKTGDEFAGATTWEFTNGAWSNVTNLVGTSYDAVGGLAPSVAYDPIDQSVLEFGGERIVAPPALSNYTFALSAPPKIAATPSKMIVDVGSSLSFTGTISNGLAPNVAAWSFGDGSHAGGLTTSHIYSQSGVYTVNFTVTDFLGRDTTTSVTILVNAAPSASFALAPSSPVSGAAVGFVPTVSGGTAPFTFAWSFGDGSNSAAAAPSHTYSGSGSFTVKLSVTDALGVSANSTQTVSVSSAPSTAVSLSSGTGLYLLLGIILLLVIVVVLAILLVRKPRSPRSAPEPYTTTAPSPPPAQPAIYDEGPPTPPSSE
ncbi:MAG: PKD domain-containing protein [Thermoplasmata archaeon]